MKNGDMPAMPIIDAEGRCSLFGNENLSASGLTKREMFAMAAMQGILSNPRYTYEQLARHAVNYADALLAELEKQND